MKISAFPRSAIVALTAAVIVSTAAWRGPEAPPARAEALVECQFVIRATNSLSIDVWVDLYDSEVRLTDRGLLHMFRQLKIQNHRLSSGQTMDRRYTAPGGCARARNWVMRVRTGGAQKLVFVNTEGTTSTSRTVDLGRSSEWR